MELILMFFISVVFCFWVIKELKPLDRWNSLPREAYKISTLLFGVFILLSFLVGDFLYLFVNITLFFGSLTGIYLAKNNLYKHI
jgi:hypothetical protein